jgi:tRNA A37 threonylcarbamoyladenosine biosynthesis protein TsaE
MITDQQRLDLEHLIKSPGWQLVRQYAESQIKACLTDLERKTFGSLAEVALVQGKLQAYKAILDYPETRIWEYMQKSKEA